MNAGFQPGARRSARPVRPATGAEFLSSVEKYVEDWPALASENGVSATYTLCPAYVADGRSRTINSLRAPFLFSA
jgi:hypothetical protein